MEHGIRGCHDVVPRLALARSEIFGRWPERQAGTLREQELLASGHHGTGSRLSRSNMFGARRDSEGGKRRESTAVRPNDPANARYCATSAARGVSPASYAAKRCAWSMHTWPRVESIVGPNTPHATSIGAMLFHSRTAAGIVSHSGGGGTASIRGSRLATDACSRSGRAVPWMTFSSGGFGSVTVQISQLTAQKNGAVRAVRGTPAKIPTPYPREESRAGGAPDGNAPRRPLEPAPTAPGGQTRPARFLPVRP